MMQEFPQGIVVSDGVLLARIAHASISPCILYLWKYICTDTFDEMQIHSYNTLQCGLRRFIIDQNGPCLTSPVSLHNWLLQNHITSITSKDDQHTIQYNRYNIDCYKTTQEAPDIRMAGIVGQYNTVPCNNITYLQNWRLQNHMRGTRYKDGRHTVGRFRDIRPACEEPCFLTFISILHA